MRSLDFLRRHSPFPPNYAGAGLRADVQSGLTVAVLLVPQAMAYALLAGLPPVYGIYASLVPLLAYALLASTPHVSVGPTALASILTLTALNDYATAPPEEYLRLCLLLAGLTGLMQLLLGALRLGGLVNVMSRPVISGFVSAAAVLIFFSQVKTLLGLEPGPAVRFYEKVVATARVLPELHPLTTAVGILSLVLLPLLRSWWRGGPVVLLFLLFTTGLTAGLNWEAQGLAVLGEVPSGLPALTFPFFSGQELIDLLPAAAVLALVSFVETLSIGKTLQENYDYYRVRPNRELIALGVSKVVGVFFQAIPTSASFSRSAVAEQSGTQSLLSSLVTASCLALCALFLMDWFYYLPLPVLAAIIILSVRKLFDLREMQRLWRLDKKEWCTLIVTFGVTLFGGLQFGIAAGVLLSLTFVVLKSTKPHLAELGRLEGTNAFRNVSRFPEATVTPDVLIIRFDAELFFGNADYFQETLRELIRKKEDALRLLIIDAHTIHDLDTSGAHGLNGILDYLDRRGVELYLAGAIGPVRDRLYRFGIMDRIGSDHQFLSIQSALDHYQQGKQSGTDWDRPAVQHK